MTTKQVGGEDIVDLLGDHGCLSVKGCKYVIRHGQESTIILMITPSGRTSRWCKVPVRLSIHKSKCNFGNFGDKF